MSLHTSRLEFGRNNVGQLECRGIGWDSSLPRLRIGWPVFDRDTRRGQTVDGVCVAVAESTPESTLPVTSWARDSTTGPVVLAPMLAVESALQMMHLTYRAAHPDHSIFRLVWMVLLLRL